MRDRDVIEDTGSTPGVRSSAVDGSIDLQPGRELVAIALM